MKNTEGGICVVSNQPLKKYLGFVKPNNSFFENVSKSFVFVGIVGNLWLPLLEKSKLD